jgi:hypothetical protein
MFLYFLVSIKPTACIIWIATYKTGLNGNKKKYICHCLVLFQYCESDWTETIFAALKLESTDGNVVMPVVHRDDVSADHNFCETEVKFPV